MGAARNVLLAAALWPSVASAATHLKFTSQVRYASPDCGPTPQDMHIGGEVDLAVDPATGLHTGTLPLVYESFVVPASFTCDMSTCTRVSSGTTPGSTPVYVRLEPDGAGGQRVAFLFLVAIAFPMPSEQFQYRCDGTDSPNITSYAWLGGFHESFTGAYEEQPADVNPFTAGYRLQGFQPSAERQYTGTGSGSGMDFSGSWRAEVTTDAEPVITSVSPQFTLTFLQGISASNDITANADFMGRMGSRQIGFRLNGMEIIEGAASGSATHTYDVGTDFQLGANTITARAILDGQGGSELTLMPTLHQVVVPQWAPAMSRDGGGISYAGSKRVPMGAALLPYQIPGDVPFVSGTYAIGGSGPDVQIRAHSSGATSPEGRVSGKFDLMLGPFPVASSPAVQGSTKTALVPGGMNFVEGDMRMAPFRVGVSKCIGLFELVPGVRSICSVPGLSTVCDVIDSVASICGSAGIKIRLTAQLGIRDGALDIVSGGGDIGPYATLRFGASARVLGFKLASFSVSGGGEGCMPVEVTPEVKIDTGGAGGKLTFSARGHLIGVGSRQVRAVYAFGGACATGGGLAPILPRSLRAADGEAFLPDDGAAAVATSRAGSLALAWSEAPAGTERPAGAVRVAARDGQAWSTPVEVTGPGASDRNPAVAFSGERIVVAWEHHDDASATEDLAAAAARTSGLEIRWAEVDATTGVVASGALTTNGVMDFAPALCAFDGGIHAVWARGSIEAPFGSAAQPLALVGATYSAGAWSAEELVAGDLHDVLGFQLACRADGRRLVALTQDRDGSLRTAADREIAFIDSAAGSTLAPLTSNAVADYAVRVTFDPAGTPVFAWVQGDDVVGFAGEPGSATPAVWARGVGVLFTSGALVATEQRVALAWEEGTGYGFVSAPAGSPLAFSPPERIDEEGLATHELALSRGPGGAVVFGSMLTAYTSGPGVEPAFEARSRYRVEPLRLPGAGPAPDGGAPTPDGGAPAPDGGTPGDPGTDPGAAPDGGTPARRSDDGCASGGGQGARGLVLVLALVLARAARRRRDSLAR